MKRHAAPPNTLHEVIRRAHLRMALVSIALAGALLLVVGIAVLRLYLGNNVQLLARSLAYTVEAALVFDDQAEATRVLEQMLRGEGIAHAQVLDASQALFAQWSAAAAPGSGQGGGTLGEWLAAAIALPPGQAQVLLDGLPVGHIVLHSDGSGLLRFLLWGLGVLCLCLAISSFVGVRLSRSMLLNIALPLQELARVARAVRRDRSMEQRVPPAQLAELRALGEDFNALLAELQMRYAHLQQQNSALSQQAATDRLTGLANRLTFEQSLGAALHHARQSGHKLLVFFLDHDDLKQVNDVHGHAAGDELLKAVAQRLRAQVRETDLVARLGGDEFAILVYPLGVGLDVQQMADKIQAAVRAPLVLDAGVALNPTVSVGAAIFPLHGQNMEDLMAYADQCMYASKARKKSPQTGH